MNTFSVKSKICVWSIIQKKNISQILIEYFQNYILLKKKSHEYP